MAYDIGTSLFVELLGMTQYPGSPFTGNIFRDLIMFFIVPTIFIIMVLYIMSGRIIPNRNFRIMLGVGAYLFIIAGGYYSFFALLAGPYFIFLIFILGVLGYLGSHFRPHGGEGGGPYSRGEHSGGGYSGTSGGENSKLKHLIGIPAINPREVRYLKNELHKIDQRIRAQENLVEKAEKHPGVGDIGKMAEILDKLNNQREEILDKLHGR